MTVDQDVASLIQMLQQLNQLYAIKTQKQAMVGDTPIPIDPLKIDYAVLKAKIQTALTNLIQEI